MDLQKEREAFERHKFKDKYDKFKAYYDEHEREFGYRYPSYSNDDEWEIWLAAKAQAVPEGFVLVSQKELLELVIAINAVDLATHTDNKTNEVREMWLDIAIKLSKLGEYQEPTND